MTELKKMQEYVREKVIMAAHPECETYEDALEKELGWGCVIQDRNKEILVIIAEDKSNNKEKSDGKLAYFCVNNDEVESCGLYFDSTYEKDITKWVRIKDMYKIIGRPLTIERIFPVLELEDPNSKFVLHPSGDMCRECGFAKGFHWEFEKTFEEQTEETQKSIAKALGWEG